MKIISDLNFYSVSAFFCLQEQRLRYLKQQEQRQQQQAAEQEKLQRLRENIENQESRLKKVRALKGQVEQKRVSNGKLGKLIDFMNSSMFGVLVISNTWRGKNDFKQDYKLPVFMTLSLWMCSAHLSSNHLTPNLSPVEEIEQMNNLFQQKQRELVMAASKVEELSRQLELLKNSKMENNRDNQSSVAELDRLYKELQVCKNKNKSNGWNETSERIVLDKQ